MIRKFLSLSGIQKDVFFDIDEHIFLEGDASDAFYIICSGDVEIHAADMENAEVILSSAGKGSIIGEVGSFDKKPRTASVIAKSYTVSMSISKETFTEIEEKDHKLALKILKELGRVLAERLRWCDKALVNHTKVRINDRFLQFIEDAEK